MKQAIITGADGFIGRYLARRLLGEGIPTIAISRRRDGWSAPGLRRITVDRSNPRKLLDSVTRECPDPDGTTVFHMAGLSAVQVCHERPLAAFESNVHLTMELLEVLRELTVRRIVFPSTGLVYNPSADPAVDETYATSAQSIYGATKLASEGFVRAYFEAYGFHCGIARLSNVFGAGMSAETVIGRLFGQVISGVPLSIRSGKPVRDFLYVDDAVGGLLAIAQSLGSPGCSVYNVSSGVGVTIGFTADAVARAFKLSSKVLETDPKAIGTVSSLVLSNERLSRDLGWHPHHSLDSGLAASVEEFAKTAK